MISIIIIDDHPLFRQGVADALSLERDFTVIGQASNGEDGLTQIRDKTPNIAIVDINLPGMNGQLVARQVILEKLPTKVVLLTAYDDSEQKIHAIRAGVAAYCTKDVRPEDLVKTIRVITTKEKVDIHFNDQIGLESDRDGRTDAIDPNTLDLIETYLPLSGREMEVLSFITRGLSNKEIANTLKISHQTVKNHVTAILRKLGVDDRTQAAVFALQRGWVRLQTPETNSQE